MRNSYKFSIFAIVVALIFFIFDISSHTILRYKWLLSSGAAISLILNLGALIYEAVTNIRLLNRDENSIFDIVVSLVFIILHAISILYTGTLLYIIFDIFIK